MADGGYEWDSLATGRTLIAFDQRSGGRSQLVADSAKLSAEYYVRDLEALRVHFGLERMTLIGQSWGAMLAAMYTMKYPDRVERLLLLSPGSPTRAFLRQRVEKTDAVVGAVGVARIAELAQEMARAPDSTIGALCRERYALIFRAYLKDVTALSRMRVGYCDGSPAALRHELGAMDHLGLGEYDFLPQLAKMHMPALVVEGADTQVPLDATRAWAAALPNARLLLIQGAHHILYLEGDPPRTTQLLRAFLDGAWPEGAEVVRP
jgi:proline iminopeptidase